MYIVRGFTLGFANEQNELKKKQIKQNAKKKKVQKVQVIILAVIKKVTVFCERKNEERV